MKLRVVVYSKDTTAEGVATERGRESTLTVCHTCHRPRIPFGHVLIERRCLNKHCKRGCNKEKKGPTHQPTTNNNKRVPFQTHKNKNNKTCENCDPMRLELSYIQNTQQRKAWPQREGKRVHLLSSIVVTAPVSHLDTSELNADAV